MIYQQHISLILVLITSLLCVAMDPHMAPPVVRQYPLDFQPMPFADDSDDDDNIDPHPIIVTDPTAPTFEGINIKDLETVFNAAPQEAQFIVSLLKDSQLMDEIQDRGAFLIGNHGSGKTVLAKALAYKLCSTSPWAYQYISSRAFMGEYRNQTGVCLRSYLAKIEALKRPTLLIIDQLNKILDYPNSSSDDTSFASDLICGFLDDNEGNNNVFLLGIMDRATKLDQRLKSRMLGSCTWLEEPTNPDLKRIIFTSKCITDSIRLHPEVTTDWFTTFLAHAPTITGRNYRCLAIELHKRLKQNTFNCTWIGKNALQIALTNYLAAKKDVHHIDPYEAYVDRLERLHQEEMARMQQLYDERMQQMVFEFVLSRQLLLLAQQSSVHNP